MKKIIFATPLHPKLKKYFLKDFVFFWFLKPTELCSKIDSYSQDEMSRKHFSSDGKLIKNVKNLDFTVFFIIERWFFKGIHRKNKKVKTVFASILIPKCVFSKTKIQNILNHRVQFIMKIMIFRKIKKSCNTKTL